MSPQEPNSERRRLRAPTKSGQWLAIPPFAEMPAIVRANQRLIATWTGSWLGRPLTQLRQLGRRESLNMARQFTAKLDTPTRCYPQQGRGGEPSFPPAVSPAEPLDRPLIVSGHQPELFHAGVWAKNFLLDRLAAKTGGIGLNLIVDNDIVNSTNIAVPCGSREQPGLEQIPFDANAGSAPWEEANLRDETLFCTFADRVANVLVDWSIEPLLSTIWPVAVEQLARSTDRPRLFELLTIARRAAECRAGLNNLELPISQLCETESFAWFAAGLLNDPQRTHTTYNEVVADYRQAHRIRNRQHPVPDLGREHFEAGEWLESPFWIWRSGDTRRGRLFVRRTSEEVQLSCDGITVTSLEWPKHNGAAATGVQQVRALASRGWKLRPRALTNTLFARIFLADVFVHGIGGSKYDEMTDRLIARLFGVTAPNYLTVTATQHLPINPWPIQPADIASLNHRLWDFDQNPERTSFGTIWLNEFNIEAQSLIAEKQRLFAEQLQSTSRAENNQRRLRWNAIRRRLAVLPSTTRQQLIAERDTAKSLLAANSILKNREFAFCLHPLSILYRLTKFAGDDR